MNTSLNVLMLLLASWCLMFGCLNQDGDGQITGWLTIANCDDGKSLDSRCPTSESDIACSAFDLGANFYALELFGEQSAKLRIQKGGAQLFDTDAVVIDFRDIRELRGRLGTPLAVGRDESVRAALILGQTCPMSTQSLELSGEIIVEQFGIELGDRIVGEIKFLEVRDGRDPLSGLIGVLRGRFDFEYRKGTPFEQFYR